MIRKILNILPKNLPEKREHEAAKNMYPAKAEKMETTKEIFCQGKTVETRDVCIYNKAIFFVRNLI